MEMDLLHPDPKVEATKHKLKRLIPNPNSFFMDVKCPGCLQITTVFSHAQTVVLCGRTLYPARENVNALFQRAERWETYNCNIMLCQPTGGKCKLTEGCSFRKKVE